MKNNLQNVKYSWTCLICWQVLQVDVTYDSERFFTIAYFVKVIPKNHLFQETTFK